MVTPELNIFLFASPEFFMYTLLLLAQFNKVHDRDKVAFANRFFN